MPILHWLSRSEDEKSSQKVPFRLLDPVPELSAGDQDTDNMLIEGDNLDALKALLPFHAGKVKCVFIDPPYNTQSAFEHYDDNLEHAKWLSMIYPRLEVLRDLLAEDGSIWVTIDDNEAHYLKVVMDEVFGRKNFVANIVWEKADSPRNSARQFSTDHDHLFVSQCDRIGNLRNCPVPRKLTRSTQIRTMTNEVHGYPATRMPTNPTPVACTRSPDQAVVSFRRHPDDIGASPKKSFGNLMLTDASGGGRQEKRDQASNGICLRCLIWSQELSGKKITSEAIARRKTRCAHCFRMKHPLVRRSLSA